MRLTSIPAQWPGRPPSRRSRQGRSPGGRRRNYSERHTSPRGLDMRNLLPIGIIGTVVLFGAGAAYADGGLSATVSSSVNDMGGTVSASADTTNGALISVQGAPSNP